MQSFTGLQRKTLRELVPDFNNALIVAIIIAKQQPRTMADAKNDKERAVWNFTLRDSLQDYVNVTIWASSDDILEMNCNFHIGDVVEVIKPRIEIRNINDYGEQFRPMVTSPYALSLNEKTQLVSHDSPDARQYYRLLNYTTKPLASFIKLSDVQSSTTAQQSEFMDLLGAVRSVGEIRAIKTKTGKDIQVREIIIFDHTSPGFRFSIWDMELILRASNWKPRAKILFITDVRIGWSPFHRTVVGNLSPRSIITEDPVGPEADILRNYAQNAPLQPSAILDQMATSIVDPNNIQNVMSVKQVQNKIDILLASQAYSTDQQFTGLLYVFISRFDLDGPVRTVLTKCSTCYAVLPNTTSVCENAECLSISGADNPKTTLSFDLRMTLTDHTGSLEFCRLSNNCAESILSCPVNEFLLMSDNQKLEAKLKYLLERCAVRIMVLCLNRKRPLISILSCTRASSMEVANRLPQY